MPKQNIAFRGAVLATSVDTLGRQFEGELFVSGIPKMIDPQYRHVSKIRLAITVNHDVDVSSVVVARSGVVGPGEIFATKC